MLMNLKYAVGVLGLLVLMQGVIPTIAAERKKKEVKVESKKESAYEKFFKGKKCETKKGMITLHKMDGKVYLEYPLRLLGKHMLLGSTISEITDNRFGSVGEKPFSPAHIMFTKTDSLINLRAVDSRATTNDASIAQRLKESKLPAVVRNFKIETYNADSTAVIFNMTDYFLEDISYLSPLSPYAPITWGDRVIEKDFKRDNCQIGEIKAFEDNVSIRSALSYEVSVRDKRFYYIYKMPFTAVMTRSLIFLPEEPMRPRYADPRIGIFFQGVSEFSNTANRVKTLYYTHRWRLEPSDEAAYRRGELVEPKQQIVYYVDNAFPEVWKKYIKAGVETWQAAFEKIGFKNAIVAKDFPLDDPEFDPENLKYSCVRYSPSYVANAMGPSWTDPRSGEIINASVYLYHNLIELVQQWRFLQTASADPSVRKMELDDKDLGECIRYVVAHEVGHTLGYMHNMAASAAIPVDSLRSPSFTQKYGTTYSIMDYARNNYVAQPGDAEKGVSMTPPYLGLYDYYAVKWLYTPLLDAKTAEEEVPVLDKWITEKSGDPVYRYGKQQIYYRWDPSSLEEDLSDDAVQAAAYGVSNLKYLLKHLNEWVGAEDKDYRFRETIYNESIYQYVRYLNHVLMNIGGIYLNERYANDVRPSYVPVEREKQKRALKFLLEQIKDLEWLNNPELLEGFQLRSDITLNLEDMIFQSLIRSMSHVLICGNKAKEDPYTLTEFVNDIYDFVMAPTKKGKPLNELEKKLQMKFLALMIGNSTATVQGGKVNALAWTSDRMIAIPESVKAKSRADHGVISPEYAGMFTNAEQPVPAMYACHSDECERAGFSMYVDVKEPAVPMGHVYFNIVKKAYDLVKSQANTGSADTRNHYKLMLFKLQKALK